MDDCAAIKMRSNKQQHNVVVTRMMIFLVSITFLITVLVVENNNTNSNGFVFMGGVHGLSSSSSSTATNIISSRRPIVILSNNQNGGGKGADVSEFLYGKLQRATSIYGSGLLGPATATINSAAAANNDIKELLLSKKAKSIKGGKEQIQSLNKMLWKQFGMATVEGTIERDDLLWKGSSNYNINNNMYQPILAELKDTIVFFDVTTSTNSDGGSGGGGGIIGGMLSSLFPKKQELLSSTRSPPPTPPRPPPQLDIELIKAAITGGAAQIYIVCESDDTKYCFVTLKENKEINANIGSSSICRPIITIVSPDDDIVLGSSSSIRSESSSAAAAGVDDKSWTSVRPQDLEGELSQSIYVRDGSFDFDFDFDFDNNNKSKSETRIAAAAAPSTVAVQYLARHNLAEVVVQCALRLITTTDTFDDVDCDIISSGSSNTTTSPTRVVRVSPSPPSSHSVSGSINNDGNTNLSAAETTDTSTSTSVGLDERPNADYFSRTGGKIAKAIAGTVTSVDWTETLQCFENNNKNGNTKTIVKIFPKRPDI